MTLLILSHYLLVVSSYCNGKTAPITILHDSYCFLVNIVYHYYLIFVLLLLPADASAAAISVTIIAEQQHHTYHHRAHLQPTSSTFTTPRLPQDAWCHTPSPATPPHAITIHHGSTFTAVPRYTDPPRLNLPSRSIIVRLQLSYSGLPWSEHQLVFHPSFKREKTKL